MRVIVGVGDTEARLDAVVLGARLATLGAGDGHLVLARAYSPAWGDLAPALRDEESLRADAEQVVSAAREEAGRPASTRVIDDDAPARGLQRIAEAEDADVIVVSSSRRGALGRAVLGGVAEDALRDAPCAVAVAPIGYGSSAGSLERVGVAFDGEEESEAALTWAARVFGTGVELTLYRALDEPALQTSPTYDERADDLVLEDMRARAREALETRAAELGTPARAQLIHGPAGRALVSATEREDLFVTGSRGRGAVAGAVLGSVAAKLIRDAACPVVVLPRGVPVR